MGSDPRSSSPRTKRAVFLIGVMLAVLTAVLMLVLFAGKQKYLEGETRARSSAASAGPPVAVVTARPAPPVRTIELVGEAHPYAAVTLYAKVSGYLKEIRVDKGDTVKEGDVLAVIESPEIDRQYDAALADAKNKRLEAERAKKLIQEEYISRQDADTAEATAQIAEANAAALKAQKDYEIVRAPFSAKVTARYVDTGALLQSATTSQTTAQPIVMLSQIDRLRVYVYLDQSSASLVHIGDRAVVFDAVRPDIKLTASITRLTGELDATTRTLLSEIVVDNRKGAIIPGSFVKVSLSFKAPPYIQIPPQALVMRGEKTFVAVLSDDDRVTFRPVTLAESNGQSVRIVSGLSAGERVVLNLGESVSEGQQVRPASSP
jgi:RND family efflux transporter MFP subunit